MSIAKVLHAITSEGNLKLSAAKSREERANIIAEDYGISWITAYCLAGIVRC